MGKHIATIKTDSQIANLLGLSYRLSIFKMRSLSEDGTYGSKDFTHRIVHVNTEDRLFVKQRLKAIGGKNIIFRYNECYFMLEATPEEKAIIEKRKKDEEYWSNVYKQLTCIALLKNIPDNLRRVAVDNIYHRLRNNSLDQSRGIEWYFDPLWRPHNIDEERIYKIITNSCIENAPYPAVCFADRFKCQNLARVMSKKIKDKYKRERRRVACVNYGLNDLGEIYKIDWNNT